MSRRVVTSPAPVPAPVPAPAASTTLAPSLSFAGKQNDSVGGGCTSSTTTDASIISNNNSSSSSSNNNNNVLIVNRSIDPTIIVLDESDRIDASTSRRTTIPTNSNINDDDGDYTTAGTTTTIAIPYPQFCSVVDVDNDDSDDRAAVDPVIEAVAVNPDDADPASVVCIAAEDITVEATIAVQQHAMSDEASNHDAVDNDVDTPTTNTTITAGNTAATATTHVAPQQFHRNSRPEYIFVRICKPTQNTPTGIAAQGNQRGKIRITSINPQSLLGRCQAPIGVGDRIIAINGFSTNRMVTRDVAEILRTSKGIISVLIHNPCGNPNRMSTTIQKPDQQSSIGVAVKKSSRGALVVKQIHAKGLFDDTLLMVGDRFVQVNQYHCTSSVVRPEDVHSIVSNCQDYLTIITHRRYHAHGMATVLCTEQEDILLTTSKRQAQSEQSKSQRQRSRSPLYPKIRRKTHMSNILSSHQRNGDEQSNNVNPLQQQQQQGLILLQERTNHLFLRRR